MIRGLNTWRVKFYWGKIFFLPFRLKEDLLWKQFMLKSRYEVRNNINFIKKKERKFLDMTKGEVSPPKQDKMGGEKNYFDNLRLNLIPKKKIIFSFFFFRVLLSLSNSVSTDIQWRVFFSLFAYVGKVSPLFSLRKLKENYIKSSVISSISLSMFPSFIQLSSSFPRNM